jgi:hypothetical protein
MSTKMTLVALALLLGSPMAHAGKCPADTFAASKAIWNWGDVPTGQVQTAMHPCGRQMTCIGGKFHPLVRRSCHWD